MLSQRNLPMKPLLSTLLLALLLVTAPSSRSQQTASQAPSQQAPTFSTDVKVVNVLATVRSSKGQVVRNLTRDDFVLEDNGRPRDIKYFAHETDLPLTLGLLVDTSLSERRMIPQERSASYTFLEQVLRENKDKAFLIHFDFEVELLQDLTSSRQKLEAALNQLETPAMNRTQGQGGQGPSGQDPSGSGRGGRRRGGGTDLYDAVFLASDELMHKQQGRKALVVLSDGMDTGSKLSLDRAIEAAQRADTLVYAILIADQEENYNRPSMGGRGGWGGPGMGRRGGGGGGSRYPAPQQGPSARDGKKVMERLARETGGRYFEVSKKLPVDQIYAQIQEELRSQYNLGFTPDKSEASSGYHKLHVATKQKDLIVQAREGYYAD